MSRPSIAERRADALAIFRAALEAADPARAVRAALSSTKLSPAGETLLIAGKPAPPGISRVRAIAFGKAACAMAGAASEAIPERLFAAPGIAVTSRGSARAVRGFRVMEAGHPLPDEAGAAAARSVIEALSGAGADEMALILVSGGGSALLPAPAPGISLADKIAATRLLLDAGADIGELNTVRKHLSLLKGGGLARAARPAHVRALLLSDVIGDDPSVIASGPAAPDPTTFADALAVLRAKGVLETVPRSVRARLEAGARGEVEETPKPGDPLFARVDHAVIGSNSLSVAAAAAAARRLGYRTVERPHPLIGQARAAAGLLLEEARHEVQHLGAGAAAARGTALIAGGETTVTVRGKGTGGRNQEMALALAIGAETRPPGRDWAFLSAGTDGIDGPTSAAGGLTDGETAARIRSRGLDPVALLDANDSHNALGAAGDLITTGPTGTNVADVHVLLF